MGLVRKSFIAAISCFLSFCIFADRGNDVCRGGARGARALPGYGDGGARALPGYGDGGARDLAGDGDGGARDLAGDGEPELDFDLIATVVQNAIDGKPIEIDTRALPMLADIGLAPYGKSGEPLKLVIDLNDGNLQALVGDGLEVWGILGKIQRSKARHDAKLAKEGRAEIPLSTAACAYTLTFGDESFVFDEWGELLVDRRFASDDDIAKIAAFERAYRKFYEGHVVSAGNSAAKALLPLRSRYEKSLKVPVFRGFEDARYQQHDELIVSLVNDFNSNKVEWVDGYVYQCVGIPDITPAMVKSQMIEESGGGNTASLNAWAVDPLQVNVPGDWDDVKKLVGLEKPSKRNEGTVENNVRAAIKWLARKGFSSAACPARMRPKGYFDNWTTAMRRYNARRDRTADGRYYSEAYADKIMRRAADPLRFEPIEIKTR